ncbi:MAG TPA: biotin/lipoyl-binding protein, partial [Gemmatimonadaceae bacterium]|nr:biotin/lipoyl-binding protein [Gemmatimonadaceae bacterium]
MTKRTKYVALIAGLAVIAVVVIAAVKKGNNQATLVREEKVGKRDLVASVTASGQVEPHTKVDVASDVSGRITQLSVKEGQMVTKGQFLLQIDPSTYQADVQRNEAAV